MLRCLFRGKTERHSVLAYNASDAYSVFFIDLQTSSFPRAARRCKIDVSLSSRAVWQQPGYLLASLFQWHAS